MTTTANAALNMEQRHVRNQFELLDLEVRLLNKQIDDLAKLGVPRELFAADPYGDEPALTPAKLVELGRIVEAYLNRR